MAGHFDEKAGTWDLDPIKVARAESVARQIRELVELSPETDLLDFGSGTGLLGFQFLPHVASVTFADPSEGMLREVAAKLRAGAHVGGRTLRLDPDDPELPHRYGAIVSLMTLHHVSDPPAVIRLLADHLHPGGWLALCDLDTEDGTFHDDPEAEVHHGFDRRALAALAAELGLEQVRVSTPWVMRLERPSGPRSYPLFLLTARRPLSR